MNELKNKLIEADNIRSRVKELMRIKNIDKVSDFANETKIPYATLINLLHEKKEAAISYKFLKLFGLVYQTLNMNWLFYGTGYSFIDPGQLGEERELVKLKEEMKDMKMERKINLKSIELFGDLMLEYKEKLNICVKELKKKDKK